MWANKNLVSIIGNKFHRLTVTELSDVNKHRKRHWICRCECGKYTRAISTSELSRGTVKSCGCLNDETRKALNKYKGITHGMSGENPEYRAWASIKERCYNGTCKPYHMYGGRGITMCEDWIHNFPAFLRYVGARPSPKHSIDRFPDNNGNYEPNNIRWATQKQQCENRRSSIHINHNGVTMIMSDWARHFGIKPCTLSAHIRRKNITSAFAFYEKIITH